MRGSRSRREATVAEVVARNLLVRALRQSGMHHVLSGAACAVGIVVEDEDDRSIYVSATKRMLSGFKRIEYRDDDLFDYNDSVISVRHDLRGSIPYDEMVECLAMHERSVIFVPSFDSIPSDIASALDGVVKPDDVDVEVVRGAFWTVLGRLPDEGLASAASVLPVRAMQSVFLRGRTDADIERKIRVAMLGLRKIKSKTEPSKKAAASPTVSDDGPALDDLAGLGAAGDWGRALAVDLDDYKAGRIQWSDMDRGVLVSGPPGTGKTTFAQALGRTCKVPVFIHSLARWQAKGYLNDLLKAMRGAFEEAKKSAPAILFLDEIDSFGDRETLEGRGEQYSREVINGFLECLDGVEGRDGVIVVGATNNPSKIDAAIRRPGRLDKHVIIPLPDVEGRKGILRYHLQGDLPGVDLAPIAEMLEGSSGAAIEQIVRDARRAARADRRSMSVEDLSEAIPGRTVRPWEDYWQTCVHEVGHAVVGHDLRDVAHRMPIRIRAFRETNPYLRSSGDTLFDNGIRGRKAEYLAEIATLMGGLAAEEVVTGSFCDGSGGSEGSDLHRATILAVLMETSIGFGDSLVFVSTAERVGADLDRLLYDHGLRRKVDAILAEGKRKACEIVERRKGDVIRLAETLSETGSVDADGIRSILEPRRMRYPNLRSLPQDYDHVDDYDFMPI